MIRYPERRRTFPDGGGARDQGSLSSGFMSPAAYSNPACRPAWKLWKSLGGARAALGVFRSDRGRKWQLWVASAGDTRGSYMAPSLPAPRPSVGRKVLLTAPGALGAGSPPPYSRVPPHPEDRRFEASASLQKRQAFSRLPPSPFLSCRRRATADGAGSGTVSSVTHGKLDTAPPWVA